MPYRKFLLIPYLLFLLSISISGQVSYPNKFEAKKIVTSITLDGNLNETVWESAKKISNFTQREQNENEPATERTEIAILFDDNNLYIGVWAYDSEAEKITAQKMKRDFHWSSDDNIEIIISTFNDKRNGYLFVTNPNGAMADVLVTDEGAGFNKSWNGIWDVSTQITNEGWFAEFEIPFSTFKFPKTEKQIWGINFERNIRRKREQIMWQGWSRDYDVESLSQAGELLGLKNIAAEKKIELKPFISGGIENEEDENWDKRLKVGLDANYLVTPTLKANLTINTDFSQVEFDRAQINLTRFSLFFPERREFFLEGKNIFELNVGRIITFYSRQIGIEAGEEIPIYGGIRLLGKTNNTHIGVMSMQTAPKDIIETTNYSVIRIKQDILEQSNVGFIVTWKNSKGHYNYVYGTEANYFTSKIFGDKNLRFGGSITQSFTKNGMNNNTFGYNVYLSYPNDFIEYDLSVTSIEANYNPEIGFVRRKDYILYSTELQFNPRPDFISWIQQIEIKPLDVNYYVTKSTNEMETLNMEFRPLGIEFTSGDFVEFNIQRYFDRLDDDFEIFDDVNIPQGKYWDTRYEVQFNSFSGRPFFIAGAASLGGFYTGTRAESSIMSRWNINRHMNISLDWTVNNLSFPEGDFTTHEAGGRIEYSFNPKLYTSIYGQWNNEDDEILLNYRVNWIPKIGSYFYFVVNQSFSTSGGNLKLASTTILGKLIWLFSI
jgi:hypothetical protein